MRIAVCDDCKEDALSLKDNLNGQDVGVYFSAKELLTDLMGRRIYYDLYLLDIYLDDTMGGIELAKRLREIDKKAVSC